MEYIYEAHDIVPKELCQEIIEKFENDPDKILGGVGVGKTIVNENLKKTMDLHIVNKPEWETIYDQLECILATGIYRYFDYLFHGPFVEVDCFIRNTFSEVDMTGLQIQRYKVGDFFKWHVDSVSGVNRIFAFIIYLNDNDGCTEFLNGKKIEPKQGKIVFFPSTWTYPHRGQEIKMGNKYIMTGFIVVK